MNPLSTGDPLRLGPYRLAAVLGAGGMGRVYLGRDAAGKSAAIKVLRAELSHDDQLVRRFVREAHSAQAVRSHGVARVLGVRTEGGRPWIATEFLAGPTLEQAVQEHGPFGDATVRALGASLARTLHDVHAAGLVHRDVKPSNIVLTSGGPRLIDFGIARPEHGLTLTTTGQAPVTPGFGPPEQILGQRVGPPADVFALGAVLTYAATGARAFRGDHVAAVQYEVVHGEPRLDAVPPELRVLLTPCLDRDSARRPGPGQVAAALAPPRHADRAWRYGPLAEGIAEREREAARLSAPYGAGVARETGSWGMAAGEGSGGVARRRLVAGLSAGALLATVGGTAWWLAVRDRSGGGAPWEAEPLADYEDGTPPPALWGPVRSSTGPLAAPLPVKDLVLLTARSGGTRAYDVRDGTRRWAADGVAPSAGTVLPAGGGDSVFTVHRSGKLLALTVEDGRLRWSAPAGARTVLAADAERVYLVTDDDRLRAVSTAAHETLWTVPCPVRCTAARPPKAVAVDGYLIVCGGDGKVAGIDAGSGKTVWGPQEQGSGADAAGAFAPAVADGAVYLGGRRLRAVSPADGQPRWSQPATSDEGWGVPVVADGLVFAGDGADLRVCAAADGEPDWSLTLMTDGGIREAPVPQGNMVWAVLGDAGAEGVAAVDVRSGKKAWPVLRGGGGWRVAAAGNRVFLLNDDELTAMPVF